MARDVLADSLRIFCRILEDHASALNRLNVYPVPDADTGTNLLATVRAMTKAMQQADGNELEGSQAAVDGGLRDGRGNAGLIFSQILAGLHSAISASSEELDSATFIAGLGRATAVAYSSVGTPTEGTILTVLRETAESVAGLGSAPLPLVVDTVRTEARAALARTKMTLPILRESGVVDAGGAGLVLFFESIHSAISGVAPDVSLPLPNGEENPQARALAVMGHDIGSRFEVQFLVADVSADGEAGLRGAIGALGTSVVIGTSGNTTSVHVHTDFVDEAIAAGALAGAVSEVRVVDLIEGSLGAATRGHDARTGTCKVIAVAAGTGLIQEFEALGVHVIDPQETIEHIKQMVAGFQAAIVLPNDKELSRALVRAGFSSNVNLLETANAAEGLAAALASDGRSNPQMNLTRMRKALESTRSGVVVAERDGSYIVRGAGRELTVANDLLSALIQLIESLWSDNVELATIITGRDVHVSAATLLPLLPKGLEIEIVEGGQPECFLVIIE